MSVDARRRCAPASGARASLPRDQETSMVGESTGERGRSPRRPSLRLPHSTGVDRARGAIRAHLPETPLVRSELLSRALGAEVWLKNETVSPIASFKLRGA